MHSRTIATLIQLDTTSALSPYTTLFRSRVTVVKSWPEAIEQCSSFEWEDLRLEALNQYRECIAERSMERLKLWNEKVREVKKSDGALVDREARADVRESNLPKILRIRVN